MRKIVVRVPHGMERFIERKIRIPIDREIGKGLNKAVLSKYLSKFKGRWKISMKRTGTFNESALVSF